MLIQDLEIPKFPPIRMKRTCGHLEHFIDIYRTFSRKLRKAMDEVWMSAGYERRCKASIVLSGTSRSRPGYLSGRQWQVGVDGWTEQV